MPRIPRLRKGAPEASQAPEAPADEPTEVSSGESLAATEDPAPVERGEARTDATPAGDAAGPSAETAVGEATPGEEPAVTSGDPSGVPAATTSGDPLGDPPTVVAPAAGGSGAVAASEVVTPGEDSATVVVEEAPADAAPGFRERSRIRRRLRYLRRYRELAFRDLGGLTFDLHRFGRDRPDLVAQKLEALATVDTEMRALEAALRERREVTELREVGIASCPRCQTLHNTDANFCPGCGSPLRGSVVREAAPVTVTPAEQAPQPPTPAPAVAEPVPQQPDAPT